MVWGLQWTDKALVTVIYTRINTHKITFIFTEHWTIIIYYYITLLFSQFGVGFFLNSYLNNDSVNVVILRIQRIRRQNVICQSTVNH